MLFRSLVDRGELVAEQRFRVRQHAPVGADDGCGRAERGERRPRKASHHDPPEDATAVWLELDGDEDDACTELELALAALAAAAFAAASLAAVAFAAASSAARALAAATCRASALAAAVVAASTFAAACFAAAACAAAAVLACALDVAAAEAVVLVEAEACSPVAIRPNSPAVAPVALRAIVRVSLLILR